MTNEKHLNEGEKKREDLGFGPRIFACGSVNRVPRIQNLINSFQPIKFYTHFKWYIFRLVTHNFPFLSWKVLKLTFKCLFYIMEPYVSLQQNKCFSICLFTNNFLINLLPLDVPEIQSCNCIHVPMLRLF